MITLKTKNGLTLEYDQEKEIVLVNGKPNKNWKPSFIPSGEDEPDFFGWVDMTYHKLYDVYGNVSNVVDEDSITL